MKSDLQIRKKSLFIEIVVELIIGLAFLIWPTSFQKFIIYVIGALLIIVGIYNTYIFYKSKSKLDLPLTLGSGIVLLGIILLILNNHIIKFIPLIFGIYLIIRGISKAILNFVTKESKWLINCIFGIAIILFGIALIIFNGEEIIGYLLGIFITIYAIFDIVSLIFLYKIKDNSENIINITKEDKNN